MQVHTHDSHCLGLPSSYLQHYARGLIELYNLINDWLEEVFVTFKEKTRLCCYSSSAAICTEVRVSSKAQEKPSTYFGHQCRHAKVRSDSNNGHSQLPLRTCHLAGESGAKCRIQTLIFKIVYYLANPQPEEIPSPFSAHHWNTPTLMYLSYI